MNEWAAAAAPLLHGCWAEPRRCLPFPLPLPAAFCVRLAPLGAPQPCSTSSSSSSSCCSSSTSSSSSSTTTTPRRSREAGKRRYARPGIAGLSRGNRSPPPPAEAWLCACLPPAGKATKGNGGRRAGADEGPEALGGGDEGCRAALWGGRAAGCWPGGGACQPSLRAFKRHGAERRDKGMLRGSGLPSPPILPSLPSPPAGVGGGGVPG